MLGALHFVEQRRQSLHVGDDDGRRHVRRGHGLEALWAREKLGVHAQIQQIDAVRLGKDGSQKRGFARAARAEQEEALVR